MTEDPAVTRAKQLWQQKQPKEAMLVLVRRIEELKTEPSSWSRRGCTAILALIIGMAFTLIIGLVVFSRADLKAVSQDEKLFLDFKRNIEAGTPFLIAAQVLPIDTLTPAPTLTPIPTSTLEPTMTLLPTSTPEPTMTPIPTSTLEPTFTSTVPATPSPKVDSSGSTTGNWLFSSDVSALDDSTRYTLQLDAEDSIAAWLSEPVPTLVIRCQNRQYDVFIYVGTQLDSTLDDEVFTRVRYGDKSPINITMTESTTGEAMFFPDSRAAVRNLLGVNRLVVGFTPFNANPVEAVFDTTGTRTAIQPLFDECGRP